MILIVLYLVSGLSQWSRAHTYHCFYDKLAVIVEMLYRPLAGQPNIKKNIVHIKVVIVLVKGTHIYRSTCTTNIYDNKSSLYTYICLINKNRAYEHIKFDQTFMTCNF